MSNILDTTPEGIPRADLLAQIAKALNDPTANSASLFRLAELATEAEAAASLVATDARQRSLDPALHMEDVAEALAAANTATHDAARLSAARDLLGEMAKSRSAAEEIVRRTTVYRHAQAERNRFSERLKSVLPVLQAQHVEILSELMAVNELVDRANEDRPENAPILQRPEGMARGFLDTDDLSDGGAPYNFAITRLAQMTLPDFADPTKWAWPPSISNDQHDRLRRVQPKYPAVRAGWLASKKA